MPHRVITFKAVRNNTTVCHAGGVMDFEHARILVADEATPADTLELIAGEHPLLHAAIARHPHAPQRFLDWIRDHGSDELKAVLADREPEHKRLAAALPASTVLGRTELLSSADSAAAATTPAAPSTVLSGVAKTSVLSGTAAKVTVAVIAAAAIGTAVIVVPQLAAPKAAPEATPIATVASSPTVTTSSPTPSSTQVQPQVQTPSPTPSATLKPAADCSEKALRKAKDRTGALPLAQSDGGTYFYDTFKTHRCRNAYALVEASHSSGSSFCFHALTNTTGTTWVYRGVSCTFVYQQEGPLWKKSAFNAMLGADAAPFLAAVGPTTTTGRPVVG